MAAITKAQALIKLNFYMAAEEKILSGQVVQDGDLRLTRADLSQVQSGRREWQRIYNDLVAAESGNNARVRFAIWHNE